MSMCLDCGTKECCGANMAEEIERLRASMQRAADYLWGWDANEAAREVENSIYPPNEEVKK